jgi:serine/threonine protein kinase
MTLASGSRLGVYEILSLLGAGGMGEVYRARDATLNREVAVKVLPESYRVDPDRLARLRHEAQVLASLNHPNIAAIYGFEQSNGVMALILELVDGPTLADRLEQGPIAVDAALPIARQIAEALEAAHDRGIARSQAANLKLRPDGTVKVLDFGLAKSLEPMGLQSDLTLSPSVLSPARTLAGVILGTAAYMAPEQARGKAVDKRTEIWASPHPPTKCTATFRPTADSWRTPRTSPADSKCMSKHFHDPIGNGPSPRTADTSRGGEPMDRRSITSPKIAS